MDGDDDDDDGSSLGRTYTLRFSLTRSLSEGFSHAIREKMEK